MGLFDKLRRTPMCRCKVCGKEIPQAEAKLDGGDPHCAGCYRKLQEDRAPASVREIREEFKNYKIRYSFRAGEGWWEIRVPIAVKGVSDLTASYIVQQGRSDIVHLRIDNIVTVHGDKRSSVIELLQRLQGVFPYLRFSLDRNGRVWADYTFPPVSQGQGDLAVDVQLTLDQLVPQMVDALENYRV